MCSSGLDKEYALQNPTEKWEDFYAARLAKHWEQALNDASAAETARRNATQADRFVDVLLQIGVERMLEHARIAMVVLGGDDDQPVSAHDRLCEALVLYLLARIGRRE